MQEKTSSEAPDSSENVSFLIEQMKLQFVKPNGRRYSAASFLFAYSIYINSPHAYAILRKTLCLPSKSLLRSLTSSIGDSCESTSLNLGYIKSATKNLRPDERYVALYADEIQISQKIELKGNKLYGYAQNRPECPAHYVQTFMVQSLKVDFCEIVELIPVDRNTGKFFKDRLVSLISQHEQECI